MVCVKLQKYGEAEKALGGGEGDEVAGGAAGCYLLGVVAEKQGRQKQALEYFLKAIELDPTLWIAFEKVCKLDSSVNPGVFFSEAHTAASRSKDYSSNTRNHIDFELEKTPHQKEPSHIPARHLEPQPVHAISPMPFPNDLAKMVQTPQNPTHVGNVGSTPGVIGKFPGQGLHAPHKDRHGIYASSSSVKGLVSSEEVKSCEPAVNPFLISGSKSGGELDASPIDAAEFPSGCKGGEVKTQGSPFLPGKSNSNSKDILSLLKQMAVAYHALTAYKCPDAIALFKELSKNQYSTGWVLCQVARALFESVRYSEAEKVYSEIIKLEPYRLEGLEYYSTCLWHLKKQVELCELSNYALGISLYAAEAWCVVGNTFSMQKEHETALRYFKRAIQLSPSFAYAHTLCGHEYVANEDFDSGKKCYQKALSLDDKQYNAWWGLGSIYLKRELYDNALQYFKAAIKVNPRSSVLSTYLGMTYFRNKQTREALECFERAEKLDPSNPLNRYQKATVLMSMGLLNDALKILEELNVKVPKEAPIHLLIAKIYRKLGNVDKALHHYNIAMDLEPKEANIIKSLIDKLNRMSQDFNGDDP
eukprot:TRINITY_DN14120_c0_g2_i1.p1 TRINITY_DN14120_c0_g2~~TRINITY_DN14120_c0_g2_i1.p1  ORF type:complete len:588 (+),score=143.57 TRINITY_DN14120_c0_g2_i1:389-2152(+)